jgi:hypothetical protein
LRVTLSPKAKRFMNMPAMVAQFTATIPAAEQNAADKATAISRQVFTAGLSPRPVVPARAGRPTTGGAFANEIIWQPTGGDGIAVDYARLPRYALIQEIGTGQNANITNPPGGVQVRSQVGRYISANLVWSGGGGAQRPTSGRRGLDQLVWRAQVNSEQLQNVRARRIRIRREIKGKHYLRDGGAAGFSALSSELRRNAKRIFQ